VTRRASGRREDDGDRVAARLWTELKLDGKRQLQSAIFPEGLRFDGTACGTAVTCFAFSLLGKNSSGGGKLASPPGFDGGGTRISAGVLGRLHQGYRGCLTPSVRRVAHGCRPYPPVSIRTFFACVDMV